MQDNETGICNSLGRGCFHPGGGLSMQIFVLSMHRAGSSMVTRLINLMGAYFAPEGGGTGASAENPKGFWERKDIRKLNDETLFACQADWYRVSGWAPDRVPENVMEKFNAEAGRIILDMDANRPWVAKEPRFSLLFPLWRRLLEVPVCVYVHRSPIEVAQSLRSRNGFPIPFGIALWEYYSLAALKASKGLPRVLVHHSALMADPVDTTRKLYADLVDTGVQGLRLPAESEIRGFIDPKYWRERSSRQAAKDLLTPFQRELAESFESSRIFRLNPLPDLDPQTLRILKRDEPEADLKQKYGIKSSEVQEYGNLPAALHLAIIRRQHQKMKKLLESSS